MKSSLDRLIDDSKVIICLGAGGVGKTTSSMLLAFLAAERGKRVGLLSIDPAKRLAAALGISLDGTLRTVAVPGSKSKLSIDAAMIDQKQVFDDLVKKFTPKLKDQERILAHPLYVSASSKFGGAVEFMALSLLQRMIEDQKYDLIVVDTPPDSHALDFLAKPDILTGFIDSKVMSWLIKPLSFGKWLGLDKLAELGERLAGGIAEVTGVKALHILAEFLVLMQGVIEGLHRSGAKVQATVKDKRTKFFLITTLRSSPIRSAVNMIGQLQSLDLNVDCVIVNRVLPAILNQELSCASGAATDRDNAKDILRKMLLSERRQLNKIRIELAANRLDIPCLIVEELSTEVIDSESILDLMKLWRAAYPAD